jgi:hypothetical protein
MLKGIIISQNLFCESVNCVHRIDDVHPVKHRFTVKFNRINQRTNIVSEQVKAICYHKLLVKIFV